MPEKNDTEVELVQMEDGTAVEFAGTRKMLKKVVGDPGNLTIRIDFRNGKTRTIAIPEPLAAQFACHGALQKYGDSTAGLKDLDDMVMAVDELDEQIQGGEWSAARESNGLAGTSVLLQAMVTVTGKSVDAIKAFLKDKTAAEKMALRNNARFNATVKQIEEAKAAKAAKAGKGVDTDKLLAGLDELEAASA